MANEVNPIDLDERDVKDVWGAYRSMVEAAPAQPTEEERAQDAQAARTKHAALSNVPTYAAPRVIHPTNVPLMARLSEVPAMASRVPHPSDAFSANLNVGAPAVASRSSLNGTGEMYRAATNKTAESAREAQGDDVETLGEQLGTYKKALTEVAGRLEESPKAPSFPYPALEAIMAGFAKGEQANEQLRGYVKEMDKLQKDLSLLLDLNAKLNAVKDDVAEMPKDVRDLLDELKERGMDIWPSDDKAFSKEIKSDIKSMSGAHQDKAKSNLHILTNAKISHLTSTLTALWECIKDIIRRDDAAKRKSISPHGQ